MKFEEKRKRHTGVAMKKCFIYSKSLEVYIAKIKTFLSCLVVPDQAVRQTPAWSG